MDACSISDRLPAAVAAYTMIFRERKITLENGRIAGRTRWEPQHRRIFYKTAISSE
jgi:hypothetical protein